MGTCIYCGNPVGFLRRRHRECREHHDLAATRIPEFFVKALDSSISVSRFRDLAGEVARSHYVKHDEFRTLAVVGLDQVVNIILADGILTEAEDNRVRELAHAFGLGLDDIGEAGRKLKKAEILRDLSAGRLPSSLTVKGLPPLNLELGEVHYLDFQRREMLLKKESHATYRRLERNVSSRNERRLLRNGGLRKRTYPDQLFEQEWSW